MGLWLESDWVKIAPTDSTHQPPQAPRASDACGLCSQTPVWLSWPSFGQPAAQDLSASLFTCCLCALLSPYSIPEASSPGSPVSFGGHDSEGDPLVAFGVGFGWSLCLGLWHLIAFSHHCPLEVYIVAHLAQVGRIALPWAISPLPELSCLCSPILMYLIAHLLGIPLGLSSKNAIWPLRGSFQ